MRRRYKSPWNSRSEGGSIILHNEDNAAQQSTLGRATRKTSWRGGGLTVGHGHGPARQVGAEDSQNPPRSMHVKKVLDDMEMGDTVECLVEVDEDCKNCLGLVEIKRGVNVMKEPDHIMNDRGAFHAILPRIHVWQDEGEQPVNKKGLVNFTEEESLGQWP